MHSHPVTDALVGVVGPCGSGKSTLVAGLQSMGVACRHIAQEHSYVLYMWQRIANPDVLVFLDASFATCTRRRRLNWTEADYAEQQRRLHHAREHADLVIETDGLSAEQVLDQASTFLRSTNGGGGRSRADVGGSVV
jgi:ATPase subunit of ABC transporter with duplicated ATPase domains